jgi:hypothetical protein
MTALVRKAGSATEPGEITLDAQIIAGAKTFNAAMTMGATVSTSISGAAHIVNGAFNAGATSTAGGGKRLGFNVNNGITQAWLTPRNSASSTLGGCAMFLIANTVDTNQAFQIYTNLATDNDASVGAQIASGTQRGTWVFGRDDTVNLSTVYTHTFLSGGRTQLDINSTGNAGGTGGAAILRLRATGEAGANFQWYRGTDGGTFDTNSTIKWNWIHAGNATTMTGGGVDAIGFYSYGVGNYIGQLCYDGRWYIGPDSGYTVVHKSFGTWDHKTAASVGVGAIYRSAAALTSGQSLDAVQFYDNTTYKGGIGVAKTTNTSNQAGYIALVTNNGTVCYLWCDDTGRLRISTTQSATGGQATGTVVGTQT